VEVDEPSDASVSNTHSREVAAELDRAHPNWLVLWGDYTQQFVAFPLFRTPRQTVLTAHFPDALAARMDEVECRSADLVPLHDGRGRNPAS
jgi:hypothetical protein